MALFRSHDDKVLWSLTKAIRLLLPADPGFDRMLDACRQYQPAAPGLALGDPRSDKAIVLRGDVPSRVQYWPPYSAVVPKSALVVGPGAPEVLDPSWADDDTGVIVVQAEQPAGGADPAVARAVGAMALGLAAGSGGVCVDVFGFKVRDPSDLVIRVA